MENYDVIIAGASFAGLAVASRIKQGRVLLIDREQSGSHQRSACGTTIELVKEVGCEKSILKTFNTAAICTRDKEIDLPLPEQYCTIDYEKFCKTLAKQNTAEFLKARVKGVKNSAVVTSKGNFKANIIVDCTGWQAVLASSLRKNYVNKKMLSFGLETEIPYEDDKLRLFINSNVIEDGYAWIFPCKKTARFGICNYDGNTKILPNLKKFVEGYGLKVGGLHGGYFCYCLKDPIVKNIFVVGCAAGQTLPLTGEGIKRSVSFGLKCGKIIQKIFDNKISLNQGQKEYRELTLRDRNYYNFLLKAQNKLPNLANWQLNLIARVLSMKLSVESVWKRSKVN